MQDAQTLAAIDWAELAASGSGLLRLLVRRLPGEGRELPEQVELSPERGFEGDRWRRGSKRKPGMQVSLMSYAVACAVAGSEDPARLAEFGDNRHRDDLRHAAQGL